MVSVDGVTYRIERLADKKYGVVRVNDDVHVGTFTTGAELQVFAEAIDPLLLELVARDAVRTGKTSWVMHAKPAPPPAAESPEEAADKPVSTRRGFLPA